MDFNGFIFNVYKVFSGNRVKELSENIRKVILS